MEGLRMILLTAIIKEEMEGGPILVRFSGQDIMGMTNTEADIADALRDVMVKKRDAMFVGQGFKKEDIRHSYERSFSDPKERDKRIPEVSYTVEPGRNIYRNGKPFIAIQRCGDTTPVDSDEACHWICGLMNEAGGL